MQHPQPVMSYDHTRPFVPPQISQQVHRSQQHRQSPELLTDTAEESPLLVKAEEVCRIIGRNMARKALWKYHATQADCINANEVENCCTIYRYRISTGLCSDVYSDHVSEMKLSVSQQGNTKGDGIRKKSRRSHVEMRMSAKKVITFAAIASIVCLPTTGAAFTSKPCLTGARAISGVVSTSAGVALIPLQTETGVDVLRWVVRALWTGMTTCYIALLYAVIPRNKEIYLFCTLILAAHFVAAFAQTTNTAVEGIATFGPLVLPICAGLVYLPFRKSFRTPSSSGSHTNKMLTGERQATDREIALSSLSEQAATSAPQIDDVNVDMGIKLAAGVMGAA